MALPFSFGLEMGSEGRLCLNAKHVTLINPLRSSGADRRKTNGCQSYCKLCAAEKVADARKRNPAPHREAMARYDKRNPQRHLKRRIGITYYCKRWSDSTLRERNVPLVEVPSTTILGLVEIVAGAQTTTISPSSFVGWFAGRAIWR